MKKYILSLIALIAGIWFTLASCNSKKEKESTTESSKTATILKSAIPIDSIEINSFYKNYPKLLNYEKQIMEMYVKHNFNEIWHDKQGIIEFGHTLFSKYGHLEKEGVQTKFPYENELQTIFDGHTETKAGTEFDDLMLSNLYAFYADRVYNGIDKKVTSQIGWLLPRKEISYVSILDSTLANPKKDFSDDQLFYSQYEKLRKFLKKYRDIELKGGWGTITVPANFKKFVIGDSAQAVQQIRTRLFLTGDLTSDSKNATYDTELQTGVSKYLSRNGFKDETALEAKHIKEMNMPIGERIKQILVNMERCRWISPELEKSNEYIMVNIPSYYLYFSRGGQIVFDSPVVVGKSMTKTVIFSGKMSYIVFSPYWNLPTSIIKKEVKPGIAKNPNYLAQHNMEWNNGNVRQKPGNMNSLGLVKFMFPNSNNIYLHDTPSKGLFANETRAYSHGCIRVGKPRDLAIKIVENDKGWSPQKIDAAMHRTTEYTYVLKNKIPVYIGYFTAIVKPDGQLYFYKDVYERDQRLADLIFKTE